MGSSVVLPLVVKETRKEVEMAVWRSSFTIVRNPRPFKSGGFDIFAALEEKPLDATKCLTILKKAMIHMKSGPDTQMPSVIISIGDWTRV